MYSLLLLSLLGASSVQGTLIRECASTCFPEAIDATLCSSVDTRCICSSEIFLPQVTSCIESNCEEEDQKVALAHAQQFCDVIKSHSGLRARNAEPEPKAAAEAHAPQGYQHKQPKKGHHQGWWDKTKHKYGYGRDKKPKHKKPKHKEPKHKKPEHPHHYKPTTTHKKKHHKTTEPAKAYQPTPPSYPTTTHHKKPHTTLHTTTSCTTTPIRYTTTTATQTLWY